MWHGAKLWFSVDVLKVGFLCAMFQEQESS